MPKIAEIESTPNPNARKFILREPITLGVARSFETAEQAKSDSLAAALFAIPHVTNVYYVDHWVTVTQDGKADWQDLIRRAAVPIRSASASGSEGDEKATVAEPTVGSPVDQLRLQSINALLDERVRPALRRDGGDIQIIGLAGNELKIRYLGACGTCPTGISGTLAGIEGLLRTLEPDLRITAV